MSTNTRREIVLAALVTGNTIKGAAKITGVNEKTIRRWLSDPDFSGEIAQARADVTKDIIHGLIAKAETAISTLDSIMTAEKVSAHAKVQAARCILEFAMRAIETTEIIERIEKLENHAQESKGDYT